ncbi:Uncharacterised protein [uncultured archaeon]|nr:Uncharacterised protein [uncultured archaeon]
MIIIEIRPGDHTPVRGIAKSGYRRAVLRGLWPLSASPVKHHYRVIKAKRHALIVHRIRHAKEKRAEIERGKLS